MSTIKANNVQVGLSLTSTNNFVWYQPASPDGTVRLGNGNSGSVTDVMTINSSGYVGIGTSSPSFMLSISGSSSSTAFIGQLITNTESGGGGALIGSGTAFSVAGWPTITDAFIIRAAAGASGGLVLTTGAATPIIFAPSSSEAMRLDSSGNLGLGVTPSAWGGTLKAIDVNTYGAVSSSSSVFALKANAYFNGTSDIYKFNGYASQYYQATGQHIWNTAPSGTAGDAISFTQAMTLEASGALSLTSPTSTIYVQPSTTTNNALTRYVNAGGTGYVGMDSSAGGLTATYALNMYHSGAYPIVFSTSGSERMRIDSDGNVGIGVDAGAYGKLEVVGSSYVGIRAASTDASGVNIVMVANSSSEGRLNVISNHDLLFMTNNAGQAKLTAAGLFQFNSGYGSVATAYGCRAWVNFNGTGTVAINGSGNVTSITDGGVGIYTINFTNAMPDTIYSVVGIAGSGADANSGQSSMLGARIISTSSYKFQIVNYLETLSDRAVVTMAFFR